MQTTTGGMTFGILTSSSSRRYVICCDDHKQSKMRCGTHPTFVKSVDFVRRKQACAGGSARLLSTFAHANFAYLRQVIAKDPSRIYVVTVRLFDQSWADQASYAEENAAYEQLLDWVLRQAQNRLNLIKQKACRLVTKGNRSHLAKDLGKEAVQDALVGMEVLLELPHTAPARSCLLHQILIRSACPVLSGLHFQTGQHA